MILNKHESVSGSRDKLAFKSKNMYRVLIYETNLVGYIHNLKRYKNSLIFDIPKLEGLRKWRIFNLAKI